jgi:hypothetical protein
MTSFHMRVLLVAASLTWSLTAVAAPKQIKAPAPPAAPGIGAKTPGACNTKMLPIAVGNEWTYSPVRAPFDAPEQIAKIAPPEPKKVVVTVKAVDKKGADTIVTLEETSTIDISKDDKKPNPIDRTITTTITCGKDKLDISPESILFAGEPGGYLGMTVDKLDRKGDSWKLVNGGIGDQKWEEDITMQLSRQATPTSDAKLTGGKLELERVFQPAQPEAVVSTLGRWTAEKLGLTTTGRVTLADPSPDTKPSELPAGWVAFIWIAPNVGVVQVVNPYAHMYQLTDAKLNN